MYQTINDRISVIGIYQAGKFTPKKFEWQNKVHIVSEVTLVSDVKDGGVRKRHYSLVAGGTVFRITFNRELETWTLDEVWYE